MNKDWYGKTANINKNISIEGMSELSKKLDNMLSKNPAMEKKLQNDISKFMSKARTEVSKRIRSNPKIMESDPRQAYKAVRRVVYREALGGNLNILAKKKAGAAGSYQPKRSLKAGQRGGNRRKRSERTQSLEGYMGNDRGFILRFLEVGALKGGGVRQIKNFKTDKHRQDVKRGSQGGSKYGKTVNTGSRGSIKARNFFASIAKSAFANNLDELEKYIDELLNKEFNS
jgi:hypothetical protein